MRPPQRDVLHSAGRCNWNFSIRSCWARRQGRGGEGADVISRGVRVHQQPCHMLLGGSVMRTEMHGSCTRHRGSRLAPLLAEQSVLNSEVFFIFRHDFADLILSVISGIQVLLILLFLVFYNLLTWILAPKESELAAVGSRRMLFPNCGGIPESQDMPSSRGQSNVTDLGLGLQSLRLSSWDRPWSSQETDTHTPPPQVQASSPFSKYWTSQRGFTGGPLGLLCGLFLRLRLAFQHQ